MWKKMNSSVLYIALSLICVSLATVYGRTTAEKTAEGTSLQATFHHDKSKVPVIQKRISDIGEKETRVVLNGVQALETTVPSEGEHFLFVREAVKNNRFIWIVYKNKQIVDCNISTSEPDVNKFMNKFDSFPSQENEVIDEDTVTSVPVQVSELVNFRGLLRTCRSFKKQVRALRIEKHHIEHSKKQHENIQDQQEEHHRSTTKKIRSKRSAFSMIYPGTNWCGAGDKASGGYDDLGENVATDRCCREHDHCPYMIDSFSTSYNYWNYRLHTLTHCTCEERFKACLKSTGSSVANMVGYIYFNYVGTECFTLKPEKTCARRSWWGNCLEYDTTYTAKVLETSIKY